MTQLAERPRDAETPRSMYNPMDSPRSGHAPQTFVYSRFSITSGMRKFLRGEMFGRGEDQTDQDLCAH